MNSENISNNPSNIAQTSSLSGNLRQMVLHLARLCEISITLNSTLDIEQLLQHILNTAVEVLDCEAASIMLYDDRKGELMFTATTTDTEKLAEIPVPLEGSIAGTIFRENKALLIDDVRADPRHFDQVGEEVNFVPRAILGVPMTIRDTVIGVLEALNKNKGQFTSSDEHLLTIIASQAAVAINNARMHQALRTAYDDLSRVDKIKSDFMSIASHELRTPLGVILGYATFLKEEAEGDLSGHVDMVLQSAMRLQNVVEDMTNMNLLQHSSLDIEKSPVHLQEIVRGALKEIASAAQAKGQQVTIHIRRAPMPINADVEKLQLVLGNILNNAIRFTPSGGKIEIRVRESKQGIRITVTDSGIGIPAKDLEKIFDQFYQVEDHMTRRYEGLGLGLAMAKGVIEAHNGQIWAESPGRDKGTKIIVLLPKAEQ